jgi:hypothetical protein
MLLLLPSKQTEIKKSTHSLTRLLLVKIPKNTNKNEK